MFTRPGRPSDRFPSPFPNDQAAAAVYGAAPPDLSLMAKARGAPRGPVWTVIDFFTQYQEAGPNYIHALLTGYGQEPPAGVTVPAGRSLQSLLPERAGDRHAAAAQPTATSSTPTARRRRSTSTPRTSRPS